MTTLPNLPRFGDWAPDPLRNTSLSHHSHELNKQCRTTLVTITLARNIISMLNLSNNLENLEVKSLRTSS
jgi:hypothetical protein